MALAFAGVALGNSSAQGVADAREVWVIMSASGPSAIAIRTAHTPDFLKDGFVRALWDSELLFRTGEKYRAGKMNTPKTIQPMVSWSVSSSLCMLDSYATTTRMVMRTQFAIRPSVVNTKRVISQLRQR